MGRPAEKAKTVFPKRAMILAAGMGERMRPLTDDRPKAMVELLGKPLIGHTLDWFESFGLEKIVVNLHYRPDPLKAYLKAHPLAKKIILSDETDLILDTGGGVKKALHHFKTEPFFIANCDAFFDPAFENPFRVLAKNYKGEGAVLLLEMREAAFGYSGNGDFLIDSKGALKRPGKGLPAPLVYTGAQIMDPGMFEPEDKGVFSLNRIFDRALERGLFQGAMNQTPWYHIGTPETLARVETIFRDRSGP